MSLPFGLSRFTALLPGAAPAPQPISSGGNGTFQASDPASQGGASTPLLWLAVGLVINFALVADAAAVLAWPPAVAFMNSNTAQTAVVAVLVPLVTALLAYRSVNKRTAASVVRASIAAQQAQVAPQPAADGAPTP
jgi:hypothetical protein